MPRRAVLRHGAARRRPRAAHVSRRPLLVQHVGPAAAALVLPLRPGRDRVRARELGDARAAPAAARGGSHDAQGLQRPAHPRGALVARPVPAVALRGRVPRDRLLGRPGEGGRVPPRRHRAAPGSRPVRVRGRRLAVVLGIGRRARRPVAVAVQGGVRRRQRPARRGGGHGLLVHLGRPRLRARARLDPGVPEEARLDLGHAQLRAGRAGRPGDGARARGSA